MSCSTTSIAVSAAAETDPAPVPAVPAAKPPKTLAAANAERDARIAAAEERAQAAEAAVSEMSAKMDAMMAMMAKALDKPARKPRAPKAKAASGGGSASSSGGAGDSASTASTKRTVRSADIPTWTPADCLAYFKDHEGPLIEEWVEEEDGFKATKNLQIYYRWLRGLDYVNPDTGAKLGTPGAHNKDLIISWIESQHPECHTRGKRGLKFTIKIE